MAKKKTRKKSVEPFPSHKQSIAIIGALLVIIGFFIERELSSIDEAIRDLSTKQAATDSLHADDIRMLRDFAFSTNWELARILLSISDASQKENFAVDLSREILVRLMRSDALSQLEVDFMTVYEALEPVDNLSDFQRTVFSNSYLLFEPDDSLYGWTPAQFDTMYSQLAIVTFSLERQIQARRVGNDAIVDHLVLRGFWGMPWIYVFLAILLLTMLAVMVFERRNEREDDAEE